MKTALVTGSNRGIGKALADYYVAQGFTVYAGARNISNMPGSNPNLRPIVLDVEDDNSIRAAIATIKAESSNLDLVINNAGVSKGSATGGHSELVSELRLLDREKLLGMMDVNTISPLMVAKYAVPIMARPGSFIINISSLRATYANSADGNGNYGYSSSKLALNMMTLCLAHDLPGNISTFAVHPGSVQTGMNPAGQMTPAESAEYIGSIIQNWNPNLNGKFLNYDGAVLH